MKRTKIRKQSKRPLAVLKREAIRVFNTWIRQRDFKILRGRCYTCGASGANQAGHFIHSHNSVRFNPINCNLQCIACNQFKSGNLGEYAIKLIEEYGLKKINELRRESTKTMRYSREYLEEIIQKYSQ